MRLLALLVVFLAPFASAGSAEEPEVVDPVGDCAFAPGNHYMDVTAAWISDETADAFNVNIKLAEWVQPVAEGAGFAVQFKHQGVEFGVLAGFIANQWAYGNGKVSNSEVESFNETSGSFKVNPPVITILFHKDNFPHTNMMDNQLVDFSGGSIDLKPQEPFFFVPATLPAYPPPVDCDTIQGTIPYEFQVGQHTGMTMNETDPAVPTESLEANLTPATVPQDGPKRVGGFEAVALVAVVFALALRRR